jgi:hypothetical protein
VLIVVMTTTAAAGAEEGWGQVRHDREPAEGEGERQLLPDVVQPAGRRMTRLSV